MHIPLRFLAILFLCAFTAQTFLISSSSTAEAQNPSPGLTLRAPLKILVPAYFYPGAEWARLSNTAAGHRERVWAIGNPFNGPGNAFDPNYDAAFKTLRANGGRVVGYLHTTWGNRAIGDVQADVDSWLQWYSIDGFFVDEMDNVAGSNEAYYQSLFDYIRRQLPTGLVVGNPGTSTSQSYLFHDGERVATQLCLYEGHSGFLSWTPDPWTAAFAPSNFYALPYDTSVGVWQATVDHAYAMRCGWVYVTDDDLPNPWDTLPGYFETMAAYIAARY